MGNIVSLVMDIVIICLLAVCIVQCVRLSRRITALRESRKEMDATIKQFFEASAKAELAIRNFQKAASDTSRKLDADTKKGQMLTDELRFMIDSGNGLAERLESVVDRGKVLPPKPEMREAPPAEMPRMDAQAPQAKAEPRGLDEVQAAAAKEPAAPEMREADDGDGEKSGGRGEGRSRAEQELLKALQNMR